MENKVLCKWFCWTLTFLSWFTLNALLGYLSFLVYQKGISGELIIFIIATTIGIDVGIIYGTLKAYGIKAKLPQTKGKNDI